MPMIGSMVLMPSGVARVVTLNPPQQGLNGELEVRGTGVVVAGSSPAVATATGGGTGVVPSLVPTGGLTPEAGYQAQDFISDSSKTDGNGRGSSGGGDGYRPKGPDGEPLSDSEMQALRELQAVDRAVRAEERQHVAAAGGFAGPIQYEYVKGPDGKLYAVGGSVAVSASGASSDEQRERAAKAVAAAAISVQTPSSADINVVQKANSTLGTLDRERRASATQDQGVDLYTAIQSQIRNQQRGLGGALNLVG